MFYIIYVRGENKQVRAWARTSVDIFERVDYFIVVVSIQCEQKTGSEIVPNSLSLLICSDGRDSIDGE